MATYPINTNIVFPQSEFLDPVTKRPAREWVQWLQNPSIVSLNTGSAISVSSGGTGTTVIPLNGQLLIGNGTGYSVNSPTAGVGIGISAGIGTLAFFNTGVLSNIAGLGISVSTATGNVTIGNTGVLSIIAGAGISASSTTGNVTLANTGVLSFSGGTTGLTPSISTVGAITLAGTLNVANGGTGATTASGARTNLGLGSGISITITTAKLTVAGANGSMTFVNGILTAQTAAT
jgi:hypothetical protein